MAVNFCYQSVKDFLLQSHCRSNITRAHTSLDKANLHVFEMCWRFLIAVESTDGRWTIRWKKETLFREYKVHWNLNAGSTHYSDTHPTHGRIMQQQAILP